jgi:hypothetical protein
MGQSVDIVATKGRWVTFVEAKKRDWRRALEQCRAHQQVADFICIAVGTKAISTEMSNAVKFAGYGLIHCRGDDDCQWIVEPERNRSFWHPQRKKLSAHLRAISYVT